MIETILILYVRYFPINKGKTKLIEVCHKLFKFKKCLLFKHKYGFMMNLDLSQFVDRQIYFFGVYEDYILNLIAFLKNDAAFFIDVGANIGQHSLYASCVEGLQVHSFEADPATYSKLCKNVEVNDAVESIHVNNLAVSDVNGYVSIVTPQSENIGGNYIKESIKEEGIKAVMLDEVVKSSSDFAGSGIVKIDVEGAEGKVLRGGEKFIKDKVSFILVEICEVHLRRFGDNSIDLIRFLEGLGFTGFLISNGNLLEIDLENVPEFCEACFVVDDKLESIKAAL